MGGVSQVFFCSYVMNHFYWPMITKKNIGGSQNRNFYRRVECLPLGHVCNKEKGKLWAKHMGLKCGVIGNTLGTKKTKKNSSYPPQQNSKEKNWALLLALAHAHVNPCFPPKHKKIQNPIKTSCWNHHTKDKREGQRKANRGTTHMNQRKEKANPSCGRKPSFPQPL